MECLINIIKGESPSHKHKNYEIIVHLKGKGIYHLNAKDIETDVGSIVVIPPGTVHEFSPGTGETKRIYICGDFNHILKFDSPVMITDDVNGEGIELAEMIYNNRFSNSEYLAALINAFVHFLLSRIKVENEIFLAIKNIIDEISKNFFRYDIHLCGILKNSGYSEDYIRAQFKKVTGKTPTEFLHNTRISHACYLIDTYRHSISLNDVAERCGYVDYIYFSRKFKNIVGVSPRNYIKDSVSAG